MKNNKFILAKSPVYSWKTSLITALIMLSNVATVFATEEGILSATDKGIKTVIDRVIIWCDTTLLPVLIISLLISMAIFAKDDKVLPTLKKAAKIIGIVYILLNAFWLVMKTFQWLWGAFSDNTNSNIFASVITNLTNSLIC